MSGFKKVLVIFTVAIVLGTVGTMFFNSVNATSDTNTTTNTVNNTNTETTNTENTNNTTNTNQATNVVNQVDWSKIRNAMPGSTTATTKPDTSKSSGTLPKTGSDFVLKNTFIGIIAVSSVALIGLTVYNKKVGMTDETKR